jgi:heat shock protein HslJ
MTTQREALQQRTWRVIELEQQGTLYPVPADQIITLQFDEGLRIAGKSACNRYFAGAQVEGQQLRFGQVGSTRMLCPEPAVTLENAYLGALQRVEVYEVREDRLSLFDRQGRCLVRFKEEAAEQP